MASVWDKVAEKFERPAEINLADLARVLDKRSVQTPALDLIDAELELLLNTPDGRLIVTMPPQEGKLVADDTLVPTPEGWVKHGDLRVGDKVFGLDGRPIRVLEVHAPAQASVRVHFSDHGHVDVHPNHEWTLWDRSIGGLRTVETRRLAEYSLSSGQPGHRGHRYRFQLPHRGVLDLPAVDLPLDPYTLGVWLGDGSTSKAAVTHHPDDTYELSYPEGSRQVHPDTGIVTTYYLGMVAGLRAAGVLGAKHIPAVYLRGSEAQRRALLSGLIDTDGHVSASGQVSFDNANRELVESTAELLRTLGYRAHVHRPTPPKLSSSGIQGVQEMWRVTYTPHDVGPGRLARKANSKVGIRRRIALMAVEEIDPRPGRCITVDSPDGLYLVGEHMTPTHNSERCSKVFPVAVLRRNPDARIVMASYAHDLARRNSRKVRDALVSHAEIGLAVRDDVSAQNEWQLAGYDGGVFAAGVGTGVTGRAADFVIIDDPVKDRQEADSQHMRDLTWDWWQDAITSRLGTGAQVLVIMTRWHDDDFVGRLLAAEDGDTWRVLNIPAQADHDPEKGETDPLGREPGEFMKSARGRTVAQWMKRKVAAGARGWQALYQGRPSPAEGGMFKREWWKRYDAPQWVPGMGNTRWVVTPHPNIIQSWDLAFKDTAKSDYVVGQVWFRDGPRIYLMDQVRQRMSFVETCQAIRDMSAKWPQAIAKLIEDKANGPAVMAQLSTEITGLIPIQPDGSKQARASAVSPYAEAGNIWIPSKAMGAEFAWSEDFVEECAAFPTGRHDDIVDTFSQAVRYLMLTPDYDDVIEDDEFTIADTGWGISLY